MNKPLRLPITSLQTSILGGIASLAVLVILLMSLIQVFGIPGTYFTGRLQLKQEEAFHVLQHAADLEAGYLQRVINEKAMDARSLADRLEIRMAVANINESHFNLKSLNLELEEYARNFNLNLSIDILDPMEHIIIASSNASHIGSKSLLITEADYNFSISRERYAALWSDQGSMQLIIAQKVFMPTVKTEQMKVTGLLLLIVDVEELLSEYSQREYGINTSETLLVDSEGFAITKLKFKDVPPMTYKIDALPARLAAKGDEGIIATADYRGELVLAAFRHIRLSTSLGLGMVLKRDQAEIFGPIYDSLYFNLAFMALAVLILLALIAVLVRQLTHPLKILDSTVLKVESGDLSARAEVSGSTEIRRFTTAFNCMVAKVEGWREELSNEVKIRTEELEKKNAELEQISYIVSHDLKSPLVTITGFVGLLEKDAIDGNLKRMTGDVQRISEATLIMQELLDELLEFSRVGRLDNEYETFSMFELVSQTVELLKGRIDERNVEVDIQSDLPMVYGDRPRIREAIQNLIENAVKFMDTQPKPRIEIGFDGQEDESVYFVRDNGIGIDKPYQEKIFGMFERLNSDVEGTGMGLALVKRIIETHGGRIWVESDGEGLGCTFSFTLPQKGHVDG
jgi:signal transduction histidine kinase